LTAAGESGLTVSYLLGTTAGGTGRHVVMLVGGCAARGARVTVYGPAAALGRLSRDRGAASAGHGDAGPGGAPHGVAGRAAGDPPAWVSCPVEIAERPRLASDAAAVRRLRRLLARDMPDVLHAHGMRAGAVAALALAGSPARRTALAVTVHNAPPAGGAAAAVYAGLELIVARRADAVLTVSGDLADRMRRRGARDAGRALVPAPQAVPPSPRDAEAVRRELGSAGRPVVLAVGRLTAQKGFTTLIEAAARWQRRDTGPLSSAPALDSAVPLLVIAGEGPQDALLRGQARAGGVAVEFLGARGDVPTLLGAADVVVVPSTWEGQPLIVQEALRAGRPLVASRVGGIPDLTGEDGAVLVPPGDPALLAAAVAGVLDAPEAREKLAAAALGRAALLPTETAAVDQALSLYRRLAGPARTGLR